MGSYPLLLASWVASWPASDSPGPASRFGSSLTSSFTSSFSSGLISESTSLITLSFAIFVVLLQPDRRGTGFRPPRPCVSTLVPATLESRARCHLPGRRTPPAPCRSAPGAHLLPFVHCSIRPPRLSVL